MKPEKSKKNKYAFNINEINIKKKFQGSLKDFQKLNRGLYDEIENNDLSIKEKKLKLKKLKNSSVKEFVYTNKEIPDHWKTKLDYQQNLLKIFTKDTNFLYYLGHGGGGDTLRSIKESEKNNNNLTRINLGIKTKKYLPKIEKKTISSEINTISNNNYVRNGRFKEKNNNNIKEKEIVGILEEFKSVYPLFEKERTVNGDDKKKKTNGTKNRKSNYYIDVYSVYPLSSIRQKHNRRQNTFRQNIFTNLLPSEKGSTKNLSKTSSTPFYDRKKDEIKKRSTNYIFLNSDNEIFERKIKITNPTIVKYLESINFFGPYFSHCPLCNNKNLEYYKNLEPNQCLQIIQQIKKNKGKNIILNNEKNKESNNINIIENINNNQEETNENNYNKKSSKNINNNDDQNDNHSIVMQHSVGSDDKEKYDIFD